MVDVDVVPTFFFNGATLDSNILTASSNGTPLDTSVTKVPITVFLKRTPKPRVKVLNQTKASLSQHGLNQYPSELYLPHILGP